MKTRHPDLSAGILAGGASRRMGFSKARLTCPDGTWLLQHKLNELDPLVAETFIACAPEMEMPPLVSSKLTLVRDQNAYTGPLEGFFRIFQAVKTPYVFMTACDMPFFSEKLLEILYQIALEKKRTVVPLNENGPVYLFGVFSSAILDPLTELRKTTTSLKSLAQVLDIHWVPPEEWKIFDPEGRFYQNLNFFGDYEQFLKGISPSR